MHRRLGSLIALASCILSTATAVAAPQGAWQGAGQGDVTIRNLEVPVSDLSSPEAQDYVRHVLVDHPFAGGPKADDDIKGYRARQDEIMETFLAPTRKRYPANVSRERIGNVPVEVVVPAKGVAKGNAHRVLINLHGGGFISGAHTAGLVEAIPIAAEMGIKVVSVDYRMFPEYKFPAGGEDVEAVYRALLKDYSPAQIGIYGCSAGGMLTGQAVARFAARHIPQPGAIGVLCASLGELVAGDSAYLAGPLNGFPSGPAGAPPMRMTFGYLAGVSPDDPQAYPIRSRTLLASFPPTILVTGTRSFEMSAAITSHNALVREGVDAEIHVWDGLFHGFFYNSDLPESREVYAAVARFFDKHLAH